MFSVNLYHHPENCLDLCQELEAVCLDCAEQDEAGQNWCVQNEYPGYTSYASLDDLEVRYPVIETMMCRLDLLAHESAEALDWDLSGLRLTRSGVWVNILGEGGWHSGHIHPGNVLSGTAYIAVPENSGPIRFEDPNLGQKMASPPLNDYPQIRNKRFHYIMPNVGDVLIWESWLRHEVMTNQSDDLRISISFNYATRPA